MLQIGLLTGAALRSPIDPHLYGGMVWRNIGPFRGGRVSAVSGAVGIPGTFYAGYPLGGVWKTTGAGVTWTPVFDGVREASSVGAIEVAPSNPDVIYVGMGDLVTGGGINEGNGVYKSSDAGKSWRHLGLEDTRQIPSILVDPHDPNLVLIAAQGNIHVPGPMRGVFRSTDGGRVWSKTLFINDTIGVQKLAWAYDRPNVIFATTVRHYTPPTGGRGGAAAGGAAVPTGTSVYKSEDEGLTWHELKGGGLPSLNGRTSVAVAITTNAQRVFLVANNGLFRSDDGGNAWRQVDAGDTRIRNGQGGYNCGVYIDPKNPDIVYVLSTSSYRSMDGGNTFTGFKGAPGGDDPQQMWIDPTDGQRMFLGVDQGATVSLDGGTTWSLWYNQPTSQVYHISVDNQYPYWVYASQQDAGSIATRSRGDLGEITPLDWLPIAGYEFGTVAADPRDPRIIYAGGPAAGLVKITYPSGQWINISPNLDTSLALRKVGNQPIQWSATNPRELLVGFNFLLGTTDGGMHWKKLSPDLGYPRGVTPPARTAATGGGRGAAGGTGVPSGGAIESISSSSIAPGTIWVGTNNGLVKLTRNHGVTWEDVTVPDLPNPTRADISTVESSRHDPAEAYLAIDFHTSADYRPYFYRTRDYGKSWTKIVTGLPTDQPSGSFARVIREDPKKAGLLFAGTESSMYVSFDDGDDWQDLSLNLPNTSYRDLVVKDNDLVAGTYGRGIWILDDISPLRQIVPAMATEPAHLFKPGDAIRVRRNVNGDTPFPPEVPHAENPPVGAIIYYYLSDRASAVAIDVTDAAGKAVRHFSSAPVPGRTEPPPSVPDFWLERPQPLPDGSGMHRINWNLRYDDPPTFTHNYEINANPGETPASPEGPLALPGVYTVKLTVEGRSYSQTVTVRNDPRSPATIADLSLQHAAQMALDHGDETAWSGYEQVTAARAALASLLHENPETGVADAARSLDSALARVGGTRGGGGRGGGGGGGRGAGGPPAPPNFATLVGTMTRQLGTLDPGDMAPNDVTRAALANACHDLRAAVAAWNAIATGELPAFNAILAKHNRKPLTVSPVLTVSTCSATASSVPDGGAARGRGARPPG